ncbi:MAG TPA: type II toxin-antitoxin system HicB family antitoxin [Ktedonobacterales bacterium]
MTEHYSMLIEWSDKDQAYIVSFPEWEQAGHTAHIHGDTYAEAVEKGQDLLAFLVESAQEEGEPLPQPRQYASV